MKFLVYLGYRKAVRRRLRLIDRNLKFFLVILRSVRHVLRAFGIFYDLLNISCDFLKLIKVFSLDLDIDPAAAKGAHIHIGHIDRQLSADIFRHLLDLFFKLHVRHRRILFGSRIEGNAVLIRLPSHHSRRRHQGAHILDIFDRSDLLRHFVSSLHRVLKTGSFLRLERHADLRTLHIRHKRSPS